MPSATTLVALFLLVFAPAVHSSDGTASLGQLHDQAGPFRPTAADLPAKPAQADAALSKVSAGQKLLAASNQFLGVTYVLGPLGEGPDGEFDRDPLVSSTALDCTTFVEETMAAAMGGGAPDMELLRRIRYKDGVISYRTRNHFTELDWLPNNIAAGFLRDITAEVAGAKAAVVRKTISKKAWYGAKTLADLKGFDAETPGQRQARLARFRALGDKIPDAPASIAYVPLADLPGLLDRIPSGTVVAMVREDRPDKPTLVSHQFFIFDGPDGKIIRHAAYGKQVMDVPAAQYISGLSGLPWKVLGLNLAAVARPLP